MRKTLGLGSGLFMLIVLPIAYGQSPSLLTYKWSLFPTYGGAVVDTITLEYPADWVYSQDPDHTIQTRYVTDFYPLEIVKKGELITGNTYRAYDIFFEIGKELSLPFKNTPLDLYLNYTKKWRSEAGDNITNTEKIKLAGEIDAYKMNITYADGSKGLVYIFNRPPDSYYVIYTGRPDLYEKYLPVAQDIVNSFSFKPG